MIEKIPFVNFARDILDLFTTKSSIATIRPKFAWKLSLHILFFYITDLKLFKFHKKV